jgi:glycosyltransferase involved in cell wall biosynthesis
LKEKKNLIHILSNLSIGGAQILVLDILKELNKMDEFNISVITIDSGELIKKYEDCGLKVIDLKLKGLVNPKIHFKLKNILQEIQPDIIHTHMLKADFYGRIAAKQTRVPLIVSTCHIDSTTHNKSIPGKRNIFDYIDNFVIDYSDSKIIAVSNKVRNYLIKRKKNVDKKVEVIYNGIDTGMQNYILTKEEQKNFRKELGIKKDDFLICFSGRLEEQKGHKFFLDTAKDLLKERKNVKIILLGEGSLRDEIEKLIADNSLEDSVKLLGFRQDSEKFYEISNLIVLPSLWEGFGIVITEAMIKKKIVLASDVGGITEIISDNETGFLFESNNKEKLLEKLIYVIDNKNNLDNIRTNAFKLVNEKFDIKNTADKYKEFYNKFLKKFVSND